MTKSKDYSGTTIRIATRKSMLALWQAEWVKSTLMGLYPGIAVELVKIVTKGDKILDAPLAKIGGKGLFVKEIEEAITDGRADLAVHSMKDVPADLPEGHIITCVPKREDPLDAFISKDKSLLRDIKKGAKIGTSSLRRTAQLMILRPDLQIEMLRGNLDTRVRKLDEGQYDAIIVAVAGLNRLGMKDRIVEFLGPPDFLPALGQGALAIETREDDAKTRKLLEPMNHEQTKITTTAERSLQKALEGGCQVPIGGHAAFDAKDNLVLVGLVASVDGKRVVRDEIVGKPEDALKMGKTLAKKLLDAGAREILKEIYG